MIRVLAYALVAAVVLIVLYGLAVWYFSNKP